jgi:hypothetical protein
MFEPVEVPPTPALPRRWGPLIAAVVIVALLVAYITVPAVRHDVIAVWEAAGWIRFSSVCSICSM